MPFQLYVVPFVCCFSFTLFKFCVVPVLCCFSLMLYLYGVPFVFCFIRMFYSCAVPLVCFSITLLFHLYAVPLYNDVVSLLNVQVDEFLGRLVNYKKETISEPIQKAVQPYLNDKEFDPDLVRTKSSAAAGLCAWVINIMRFYTVFCEVEPKRLALEAANEQLRTAEERLLFVQNKISTLEAALAKLTAEFQAATQAKNKCQQVRHSFFSVLLYLEPVSVGEGGFKFWGFN